MNDTLRALNRFGLGARVGEARSIRDPRGWLLDQLHVPRTAADLTGSEAGEQGATLAEAGDVLVALRTAQRTRDQDAVASARERLRDVVARETRTMLTRRVRSDFPFVERLVAFWSNHLCVSAAAKQQVAVLAGHYERSAIRPHVLGRFEDMVLASARHPAMLFYLDNVQSIGPASPAGRRSARGSNPRGLNENYARELLELHTVGVGGGYDQADVEALAKILTGWTVAGVGPGARAGESISFSFRPLLHEPGGKTVLGQTYRADGEREGEQVIRDLCRRPATARFVADKLVRHFVADDPPPAAVDSVAATFRDTDGDLLEVSRSLVALEQAWGSEHLKFRTPQDWLIAVFRAVRADEVPERAGATLRQLRHSPWAPAAPKGYDDTRAAWDDPDALMNRAELARSIARSVAGRTNRLSGPDPSALLEVVDVASDDPIKTMMADRSIPVAERVALAIGGPAFQWR